MSDNLKYPPAQKKHEESFDEVRISIASPEDIKRWSYGEVKKPETINYRTFKPEQGGLFCSCIFGPTKDYECLCGRYKRIKYKGIVCEKCNVEVTEAKVRRDRMGHIDLAVPVAHIWFLRSIPSRLGMVLDIPMKTLEQVLYFQKYLVSEPGLTSLKKNQALSEQEFQEACEQYGEDAFSYGIGAEVIEEVLKAMNLSEERSHLVEILKKKTTDVMKKKLTKRLELLNAFLLSGVKPHWMILRSLPVLPPDLRPLVPLERGHFATSDLNNLYRRVINRNNRLKRLIQLQAPEIILRNEKRMLQESVDALFDNNKRSRPIVGTNKRPLKSLSDILRGKQGRFRQNLLGKRVDYSARSVIIVGPTLKLHQCGLPKKIALELFKPFVFGELKKRGLCRTLKKARKFVEAQYEEVWDCLETVIKSHLVLLNRAPTLHRLGIQAFEPILVPGKAIQLHPLVCTAFNADFDGDQMAIHLPLSIEAQMETQVLMLSTNNVLSPANGKPIVTPTLDIILGLYYMTLKLDKQAGEGMVFTDLDELELALHKGIITLHSKILCQVEESDEDGQEQLLLRKGTGGRFLFYNALPDFPGKSFEKVNKNMGKIEVTNLVEEIFVKAKRKDAIIFCDTLKRLGFHYATASGISFGKDDLLVPVAKDALVKKARELVSSLENQYMEGLITREEKRNKTIEVWSNCTNRVSDALMDKLSKVGKDKEGLQAHRPNSIFMMSDSGARSSATQIRQLAGMRGLMAKPSGEIMEMPIIANFRDGLGVLDYFNSTHGARKGLADTALKTANSGYLTRRLVDVAQDCVIMEADCGTTEGLLVSEVIEGSSVIVSLLESVVGRFVAGEEDVVSPEGKEVLAQAGDFIDESKAGKLQDCGITELLVRSPLFCKAERGCCQKCYGRDLARGKIVDFGEAVGIVAAQSIGEPGTQLTMRTFHIGGAAQVSEQSYIQSPVKGKVTFENLSTVASPEKNAVHQIVIGRNGEMVLWDYHNRERARYRLGYGSRLYVKEGDAVSPGDKLSDWDPYTIPIISEKAGIVSYRDLQDGVSLQDHMDKETGLANKVIIDWKQKDKKALLSPRITLRNKKGEVILLPNGQEARYLLLPGAILSVEDQQPIEVGKILARLPRAGSRNRDITGGLPRVSELFEARQPQDCAVLARFNGHVEIKKKESKFLHLVLSPVKESKEELPFTYAIPKGLHLNVQDGDFVRRGDYLVDGVPSLHDILDIVGLQGLANYLIQEIQNVYLMQGVRINNKHIEIIIKQMIQKVEILERGDSTFDVDSIVEHSEVLRKNKQLEAEKKKKVVYKFKLLGITKASLKSTSFISAASFQETTRILTSAAIEGKVDKLVGLKENIIVGHLIPAGTGFVSRQLLSDEGQMIEEEIPPVSPEVLESSISEEKPVQEEQSL